MQERNGAPSCYGRTTVVGRALAVLFIPAVAAAQGAAPGASVLLEDTFTAADLTELDGSRWSVLINSATVSHARVEGDAAALLFNSQAGASIRLRATMPSIADGGVVLRYRFVTNDVRGKLGLFLRGTDDWADSAVPNRAYQYYSNTDLPWRVLSTVTYPSVTDNVSFQVPPNTGWSWVRFEAAGDEIRARTWDAGTPEPAEWGLQFTSSVNAAPGVFQLSWSRASGSLTVLLDDVTVYTWDAVDAGVGDGPPTRLNVGCGCTHDGAAVLLVVIMPLVCLVLLGRRRHAASNKRGIFA